VNDNLRQMLVDSFNAEMDRYWTRFNIFSAVQVGAVVGLVNALNLLLLNWWLFRLCLLFVFVFSVTGVLNALRGHDLQRAIVRVLIGTETELPVDQQLLTNVTKQSRYPAFFGNHVCTAFSIFCCVAWLFSWLLLEYTSYAAITLPPSAH
jgi:hypothetical protein